MALAAMLFVQVGIAASVGLFDEVGAEGAACLRLAWAGVLLLVLVRPRPSTFSRRAFVGAVALFFIRRIGRPLNQLTAAARSFADGMQANELAEDGPIDLRRAIRSFNAMQRQVAGEMARRTSTLAAIRRYISPPGPGLRMVAVRPNLA